jgi:hypothetical protein
MTDEIEAKIKTGEIIVRKARFNGRVIDVYSEASSFIGPRPPLRMLVDFLKELRKGAIGVRLCEPPCRELCRNCGEDSHSGVEFYLISTGDGLCAECAGRRVTADMWATYRMGVWWHVA